MTTLLSHFHFCIYPSYAKAAMDRLLFQEAISWYPTTKRITITETQWHKHFLRNSDQSEKNYQDLKFLFSQRIKIFKSNTLFCP